MFLRREEESCMLAQSRKLTRSPCTCNMYVQMSRDYTSVRQDSTIIVHCIFFFSYKTAYLSNFKKDLLDSLDPWVPNKLNGFWPWKHRGFPLNTWYHNTSVFWAPLHSFVSSIGNCKKMRRSLIQLTPFILLNCVSPIDAQWLVRIHRHDDFSNECVDAPFFKSVQKRKKWKKNSYGYKETLSFRRVSFPRKSEHPRNGFWTDISLILNLILETMLRLCPFRCCWQKRLGRVKSQGRRKNFIFCELDISYFRDTKG